MRILVTGASGRLGRSLQQQADSSHGREWIFLPNARGSGHSPQQALNVTDSDAVDEALAHFAPDAIIHLASLAGAACDDDPDRTIAINTHAVADLAVAAEKHNVARLVFASTGAIYGDSYSAPVAEDAPVSLTSRYAESKYKAEIELNRISSQSHFGVVILRIFNIYGPGFDMSLVARLWDSRSVPVVLRGLDSFARDYTHASSVVDALISSTTADFVGASNTLNIGSGVPLSNRELVEMLSSQRELHYTVDSEEYSFSCASVEKAKRMLDFVPLAPSAVALAGALR